jgi:hypothetical protein
MRYIISFVEENSDGKKRGVDRYVYSQRFYELCKEFDVDMREV